MTDSLGILSPSPPVIVDAMDDFLYNTCVRYFKSLSNFGYRNYGDVKKLLFLIFINELVNTTSLVIPEEDYDQIEKALYCVFGTSCLIPYPNYCSGFMNLHLGDIAELSARVAKTEDDIAELETQLDETNFVIEGDPL